MLANLGSDNGVEAELGGELEEAHLGACVTPMHCAQGKDRVGRLIDGVVASLRPRAASSMLLPQKSSCRELRAQDVVDGVKGWCAAPHLKRAGVMQDRDAFGAAGAESDVEVQSPKSEGKVIGLKRVELVHDEIVKVQDPDSPGLRESGDGLDVLADPGLGPGASDRLGELEKNNLRGGALHPNAMSPEGAYRMFLRKKMLMVLGLGSMVLRPAW